VTGRAITSAAAFDNRLSRYLRTVVLEQSNQNRIGFRTPVLVVCLANR
jgi:hypothetical protein